MKKLSPGALCALCVFVFLFTACPNTGPASKYTLSFNVDGGSTVPNQSLGSGEKALKPADPTKAGHTFAGWYRESGLTHAWDFAVDTVSADITLYAKWNINSYTLSFNANDGTPAPADQSINYGAKVREPIAPTKAGFTFAGWYRESGFAVPWNFANDTVSGDARLYARWIVVDSAVIAVTAAEGGIVGQAPIYTPPVLPLIPGGGTYDTKGVFIEGRTITLSPYEMDKHEVSYELWYDVKTWAIKSENGYSFANPGNEGSMGTAGAAPSANKNHPVTMVSWYDCIVWCNAYTEKSYGSQTECVYRSAGTVVKNATDTAALDAIQCDLTRQGYRLPSEAEWEYAARYRTDSTNALKYGTDWLTKLDSASGATKPLGFDGGPAPLLPETWTTLRDEAARVTVYKNWWDGSAWTKQPTAVTGTAPVGTKAPNALGLYDMSGNVWEWCWDRKGIVSQGTQTDPMGPSTGASRIARGASWNTSANFLVLGIRDEPPPNTTRKGLGFRLCRTK